MKNCVFAGTFDPVTKGHEAVINVASKTFDNVTVAICINPDKKTRFNLDKRLDMLKAVCEKYPNVEVVYHDGMLVDLMKSKNAVYNLRGVRNETDFLYENNMAFYNKALMPELITLYIPCDKSLIGVSSTAVRKAIETGEDLSKYLPSEVLPFIK